MLAIFLIGQCTGVSKSELPYRQLYTQNKFNYVLYIIIILFCCCILYGQDCAEFRGPLYCADLSFIRNRVNGANGSSDQPYNTALQQA